MKQRSNFQNTCTPHPLSTKCIRTLLWLSTLKSQIEGQVKIKGQDGVFPFNDIRSALYKVGITICFADQNLRRGQQIFFGLTLLRNVFSSHKYLLSSCRLCIIFSQSDIRAIISAPYLFGVVTFVLFAVATPNKYGDLLFESRMMSRRLREWQPKA